VADVDGLREAVASAQGLPANLCLGWVNNTLPLKNYSMVTCPSWSDQEDVYVHSSVAEPGAVELGDLVAFQIHVSHKNMPQASAPLWKQVGWKPKGMAVTFGRYQGLISKVLPSGSGFLDCKAISETYGRDAYVHHAVMKQCDLVEGNLIAFDIHVNHAGNPQVSAPCWICCSDDKLMQDFVASVLRDSPKKSPGTWQERRDFQDPDSGSEGSNHSDPPREPRHWLSRQEVSETMAVPDPLEDEVEEREQSDAVKVVDEEPPNGGGEKREERSEATTAHLELEPPPGYEQRGTQ